ncbi:hypothetical protein F3087_00685 [Nocardia colli]|uniref:Uncharacterized protein n=1 Tax=Nocardia colli TaxID=2545717 RepID=A0A5N0EMA3_9NOCA|nr:hypothetical protein [Nocardia colli]KAA8889879.1 hypothetical protein F3087_00685 [Nocardia colli]
MTDTTGTSDPTLAASPEPAVMTEPEPAAVTEPEPAAVTEPEPAAVTEPEPAAMTESKADRAAAEGRKTFLGAMGGNVVGKVLGEAIVEWLERIGVL